MSTWPFTIDDIRTNSTHESYSRGEEYADQGAVLSITQRGNRLNAEVEGSDVDPYLVSVLLDDRQIVSATCTCPYDWGGWCKHIIAVLLTCLHVPGAVEERATLEILLTDLTREQLVALLLRLTEDDPGLAESIELQIPRIVMSADPSAPTASASPVPATPDAKKMQKAIRAVAKSIGRAGYYEYDDDGGAAMELDDAAEPYLDAARAFLENGMPREALAVLEPLTEALLDNWDEIEDIVGSLDDLFEAIGNSMTEALLTLDLSKAERKRWAEKIEAWREDGDSCGANSGLAAAEQAALTGWDYPPLLRVLRGEVDERGAWDGEPPDGADELAIIRLDLLERQGRLQEAIYLAEAEGQYLRYLMLLVRAGKARQAYEEAREALTDRSEILQLAQALQEHGERGLALDVAEHGLSVRADTTVPGIYLSPVKPLADWLRDHALEMQRTDLAITAAVAGLKEQPILDDYQRLEQVAGARMEELRSGLLDALSIPSRYSSAGAVDILLYEGRKAEALKLAGEAWDYNLRARVVDAVLSDLPDAVIPICKKEGEEIMDSGRAAHYDSAARWIQRVRDAYRVLHHEDEWQSYKRSLLEKHARKYKLVPMLKAL